MLRKLAFLLLALGILLYSSVPVFTETKIELVLDLESNKPNLQATLIGINQYSSYPPASGSTQSKDVFGIPNAELTVSIIHNDGSEEEIGKFVTDADGKITVLLPENYYKENERCATFKVSYEGDFDKRYLKTEKAQKICQTGIIPVNIPKNSSGIPLFLNSIACFPLMIVVGVLLAAMYASGMDPTLMLDINTPRLPKAPRKKIRGGQYQAAHAHDIMYKRFTVMKDMAAMKIGINSLKRSVIKSGHPADLKARMLQEISSASRVHRKEQYRMVISSYTLMKIRLRMLTIDYFTKVKGLTYAEAARRAENEIRRLDTKFRDARNMQDYAKIFADVNASVKKRADALKNISSDREKGKFDATKNEIAGLAALGEFGDKKRGLLNDMEKSMGVDGWKRYVPFSLITSMSWKFLRVYANAARGEARFWKLAVQHRGDMKKIIERHGEAELHAKVGQFDRKIDPNPNSEANKRAFVREQVVREGGTPFFVTRKGDLKSGVTLVKPKIGSIGTGGKIFTGANALVNLVDEMRAGRVIKLSSADKFLGIGGLRTIVRNGERYLVMITYGIDGTRLYIRNEGRLLNGKGDMVVDGIILNRRAAREYRDYINEVLSTSDYRVGANLAEMWNKGAWGKMRAIFSVASLSAPITYGMGLLQHTATVAALTSGLKQYQYLAAVANTAVTAETGAMNWLQMSKDYSTYWNSTIAFWRTNDEMRNAVGALLASKAAETELDRQMEAKATVRNLTDRGMTEDLRKALEVLSKHDKDGKKYSLENNQIVVRKADGTEVSRMNHLPFDKIKIGDAEVNVGVGIRAFQDLNIYMRRWHRVLLDDYRVALYTDKSRAGEIKRELDELKSGALQLEGFMKGVSREFGKDINRSVKQFEAVTLREESPLINAMSKSLERTLVADPQYLATERAIPRKPTQFSSSETMERYFETYYRMGQIGPYSPLEQFMSGTGMIRNPFTLGYGYGYGRVGSFFQAADKLAGTALGLALEPGYRFSKEYASPMKNKIFYLMGFPGQIQATYENLKEVLNPQFSDRTVHTILQDLRSVGLAAQSDAEKAEAAGNKDDENRAKAKLAFDLAEGVEKRTKTYLAANPGDYEGLRQDLYKYLSDVPESHVGVVGFKRERRDDGSYKYEHGEVWVPTTRFNDTGSTYRDSMFGRLPIISEGFLSRVTAGILPLAPFIPKGTDPFFWKLSTPVVPEAVKDVGRFMTNLGAAGVFRPDLAYRMSDSNYGNFETESLRPYGYRARNFTPKWTNYFDTLKFQAIKPVRDDDFMRFGDEKYLGVHVWGLGGIGKVNDHVGVSYIAKGIGAAWSPKVNHSWGPREQHAVGEKGYSGGIGYGAIAEHAFDGFSPNYVPWVRADKMYAFGAPSRIIAVDDKTVPMHGTAFFNSDFSQTMWSSDHRWATLQEITSRHSDNDDLHRRRQQEARLFAFDISEWAKEPFIRMGNWSASPSVAAGLFASRAVEEIPNTIQSTLNVFKRTPVVGGLYRSRVGSHIAKGWREALSH